jgi:hypothetical protein
MQCYCARNSSLSQATFPFNQRQDNELVVADGGGRRPNCHRGRRSLAAPDTSLGRWCACGAARRLQLRMGGPSSSRVRTLARDLPLSRRSGKCRRWSLRIRRLVQTQDSSPTKGLKVRQSCVCVSALMSGSVFEIPSRWAARTAYDRSCSLG